MGTLYTTAADSNNLTALLDAAELINNLQGQAQVLIKPNLVEPLQPPITTPVNLVEALISYLQPRTNAQLIIAEGTGSATYDTWHVFKMLGYTALAEKYGLRLLDLNTEKCIRIENSRCKRWPEIHLPAIAFESYILSVPVLKSHSLAKVTLTMKNMMGFPPPHHYQQDSSWKKSSFHTGMQEAVADLNRYRTPDFTLLDASVGMAEAHLWGPTCDPPVNLLVAGNDPVAIDAFGSQLLGKKWQDIDHIQSLHNELGIAEPLRIIDVT